MQEVPGSSPGATIRSRRGGRHDGAVSDRAWRTAAAVALVALAAELAFLPLLVPLDEAVWRRVLLWRGCATDRTIESVVDITSVATAALVIVVALRRTLASGVRAAWPALAAVALGALANDVLKLLLTRERPSTLPGETIGHSFPSGHVMNSVVAALAVIALTEGWRTRSRWRLAALALALTTAAGRVLYAHHWVLDAVGGTLAALALFGLGLPAFRRRPLAVPAALAVVLGVSLALGRALGITGLPLPSPLGAAGEGAVAVAVGAPESAAALRGAWEDPVREDPAGLVAWLGGPAQIRLEVPPASAGDTAAEPGLLALAGRPAAPLTGCVSVRLALNGHEIATFVPFRGWREYRLPSPPGALRGGANELEIEVRDEQGGPWRFAVAYVRVWPGWNAAGARTRRGSRPSRAQGRRPGLWSAETLELRLDLVEAAEHEGRRRSEAAGDVRGVAAADPELGILGEGGREGADLRDRARAVVPVDHAQPDDGRPGAARDAGDLLGG
jgi:membrane-associated phospholipid phosphatase